MKFKGQPTHQKTVFFMNNYLKTIDFSTSTEISNVTQFLETQLNKSRSTGLCMYFKFTL